MPAPGAGPVDVVLLGTEACAGPGVGATLGRRRPGHGRARPLHGPGRRQPRPRVVRPRRRRVRPDRRPLDPAGTALEITRVVPPTSGTRPPRRRQSSSPEILGARACQTAGDVYNDGGRPKRGRGGGDGPERLFAYGTLAPEGPEAAARGGWEPDTVRGRLYDLGPYPALVDLDDPEAGWVEGYVRAVDPAELAGGSTRMKGWTRASIGASGRRPGAAGRLGLRLRPPAPAGTPAGRSTAGTGRGGTDLRLIRRDPGRHPSTKETTHGPGHRRGHGPGPRRAPRAGRARRSAST